MRVDSKAPAADSDLGADVSARGMRGPGRGQRKRLREPRRWQRLRTRPGLWGEQRALSGQGRGPLGRASRGLLALGQRGQRSQGSLSEDSLDGG